MAKKHYYLQNENFMGIIGREEFEDTCTSMESFDGVVAICIIDPDREPHPVEMVEKFDDYIQLQFWDVEETFCNYEPITDEQGKELADFIFKNRHKKFLVHCSAGISRSAGAGMAVECIKIFHDSDNMKYDYLTCFTSAVKSHRRYSPNFKVFDTIVDNFKINT